MEIGKIYLAEFYDESAGKRVVDKINVSDVKLEESEEGERLMIVFSRVAGGARIMAHIGDVHVVDMFKFGAKR